MNRAKLAKLYKVDGRVIKRWLGYIGINHSKKFSPNEIQAFKNEYGEL